MSRPPAKHVSEVRRILVQRAREELHPGDRFLSNRQIAARFGISYQTAHRLATEMVEEGLLVRRKGAGTRVAGAARSPMEGALLVFAPRARRVGTFGHRLHDVLARTLEEHGVPFRTVWTEQGVKLSPDWLPVIWECPEMVGQLAACLGNGLMLNEEPPPGTVGSYLDSVSVDNFSGGVVAGEVIAQRWPGASVAMLAGPVGDGRSAQRERGFLTIHSGARVEHAERWELGMEDPAGVRILEAAPTAVFCANDRLADGLAAIAAKRGVTLPFLMGFDNAPVAETMNLSTVAIPWRELADSAVDVIQSRLRGSAGIGVRRVLMPRAIRRY